MILGERAVGEALVDDPRVALVSATGSTRMGKEVAPRVAARLGRSLLELGGNNAAIVAPSADLDLAVRGIVFSAVGTAGQRCTSLRRVIAHESIREDLVARLRAAYETLPIGSPLETTTLVGPLIDENAFRAFGEAITQAQGDGGTLVTGGSQAVEASEATGGGYYVHPAIVDMPKQTEIVKAETFAPILYVLPYQDLDEAITLHNDVAQGLSSSIFTLDVREAETFVSATGPTAASPTSTSARPVRRSAERSVARRTPAAVASPDRTPGAPTCVAPPTRSTTPPSCLSRRASSSAEPRIVRADWQIRP